MNSDRFSRRGLARRAAFAVAAGASIEAAPQPQGQGPLDAADQAEVDAKYANVIRVYGNRLTDEQKNRVRTVLGRHQRMLARVRAFPIENSDAPATGLRLVPTDTGAGRKG